MNYDDLYDYEFRIESVGVMDVGDLKNVVSEFRYYYTASEKELTHLSLIKEIMKKTQDDPIDASLVIKKSAALQSKERFFVLHLNTNEIDTEKFIPFEEVTQDNLFEWLSGSIHPENLQRMKHSLHELFNPPIKYYTIGDFK